MGLEKYLLNCFVLLIPVFVWNLVFAKHLPEAYAKNIFWKDIPQIIGTTENVLRIIVFGLPLVMLISWETKLQKIGLVLYVTGIIAYFLSWTFQICFPGSSWSRSLLGFMAPAFTTIIWFVGIGLTGKVFFVKIPYFSAIYIGFATLFVVFHSVHTYIIYQRL